MSMCQRSSPDPPSLTSTSYVQDILRKTSKSTEQIVIHTDGAWSIKTDGDGGNHGVQTSNDVHATALDDDEVQISGVNELRAPKRETPQGSTPIGNLTPARPSSSTPNGPRGLGSISSKRPAAPVIDLTLSDSDDDEPLTRPNKRQNTSTNGFRGSAAGFGF